MRRRRVPWIAAAIAFALASCGGDGTVDGPVLARASSLIAPGGDDAEVLGTVVIDVDEGCVRLELDGIRYPVVWPAGARWESDAPGVELGGNTITDGTEVVGSGGWYDFEGVVDLAGPAVAEAAQRCIGPTNEIAMFNAKSEIRIDP
ncbi:MAG: hypothetical protein QNJ88_11185 [Acidimicrobiia bacterium]|nr:hypothetical protein [Acidimicrobiia bacterium]